MEPTNDQVPAATEITQQTASPQFDSQQLGSQLPHVPPGWYHDGHGYRWWDGIAWGPAAPPSMPAQDNDRTLAVLSHLGVLFGGFLLPLIVYLVVKDKPETRWHAREALNFNLTALIISMAALIPLFGFFIAAAISNSAPWLFLVIFPFVFLLNIGAIVFSVVAAVKAGKGERWKYHVCIRFVRGN